MNHIKPVSKTTYQLRDYPCIYYLEGKLQARYDDQIRFLCGLGSIFGLEPAAVVDSSVLFAHISKGRLYNGTGFTEDDIKRLKLQVFNKPFPDCKTLCSWNILKKVNIKHECCIICPLSTTYLNGRIESERVCLRYALNTGKVVALESKSFISVVSIASGSEQTDMITIPLYGMLNEYFKENPSDGPYNQDKLTELFCNYVMEKLNLNISVKSIYYECIKRELAILYSYQLNSITEAEANMCQLNLLSSYFYSPPKISRPNSSKDETLNIVPVKKKAYKKSNPNMNQIPILSMDSAKSEEVIKKEDPPVKVEKTCVNEITSAGNDNIAQELIDNVVTNDINVIENDSKSINELASHDEGKDENQAITSLGNLDSDIVDTSLENQIADKDEVNNVSESTETVIKEEPKEINGDPVDSADCVPNVCIIDVALPEQNDELPNEEPETPVITDFPLYSIPKNFFDMIINCSSNEPKAVLQFITDTCSSHYLAIESVMFNDRPGLLILTSNSPQFYYFDIAYASSGYLYPMLSDATKLKLLSLNPMPVISMLNRLGFTSIQIESLSGLYCTVKELDSFYDYTDMFDDEIGVINEDKQDFYQNYMPHYQALYNSLEKQFSSDKEETLRKEYERGLQLDTILGMSYDLSDVLYKFHIAVSGHGYYDYGFNYSKDIPIIKPGILYMVTIPAFANEKENKVLRFLENVCIKVNRMPYQCIQYAKLITILKNGIMYYSTLDGDMFFDILLDVFRKSYKKIYKEMPELATHRIEYTEHRTEIPAQ